jgi:hypothetical protein
MAKMELEPQNKLLALLTLQKRQGRKKSAGLIFEKLNAAVKPAFAIPQTLTRHCN